MKNQRSAGGFADSPPSPANARGGSYEYPSPPKKDRNSRGASRPHYADARSVSPPPLHQLQERRSFHPEFRPDAKSYDAPGADARGTEQFRHTNTLGTNASQSPADVVWTYDVNAAHAHVKANEERLRNAPKWHHSYDNGAVVRERQLRDPDYSLDGGALGHPPRHAATGTSNPGSPEGKAPRNRTSGGRGGGAGASRGGGGKGNSQHFHPIAAEPGSGDGRETANPTPWALWGGAPGFSPPHHPAYATIPAGYAAHGAYAAPYGAPYGPTAGLPMGVPYHGVYPGGAYPPPMHYDPGTGMMVPSGYPAGPPRASSSTSHGAAMPYDHPSNGGLVGVAMGPAGGHMDMSALNGGEHGPRTNRPKNSSGYDPKKKIPDALAMDKYFDTTGMDEETKKKRKALYFYTLRRASKLAKKNGKPMEENFHELVLELQRRDADRAGGAGMKGSSEKGGGKGITPAGLDGFQLHESRDVHGGVNHHSSNFHHHSLHSVPEHVGKSGMASSGHGKGASPEFGFMAMPGDEGITPSTRPPGSPDKERANYS